MQLCIPLAPLKHGKRLIYCVFIRRRIYIKVIFSELIGHLGLVSDHLCLPKIQMYDGINVFKYQMREVWLPFLVI